ncbi:hypothetical protein J7T55_009753 [Diaporthe amygdali]|uniref:uncharacterized protein n=1 Tax=Phomopsis amygdali TaxID=1214568 RepID=UPI0022FEDDA0|nr:uncharacterized protein J7T55_009753 [Diaporthe amygdali]KAJ0116603.1 hypothetical protein J7T55_009753 [Diaporthe amygdali]
MSIFSLEFQLAHFTFQSTKFVTVRSSGSLINHSKIFHRTVLASDEDSHTPSVQYYAIVVARPRSHRYGAIPKVSFPKPAAGNSQHYREVLHKKVAIKILEQPALLLTNKQIRDEALLIHYMQKFVDNQNASIMALIRCVTIRICHRKAALFEGVAR